MAITATEYKISRHNVFLFILLKDQNVSIKNSFIGEFILLDCDVDMIYKALTVMSDWIKTKKSIFNDLVYYIFN